ncbi:hypothetical protein ACLMJK_000741 [Lecanora helva]
MESQYTDKPYPNEPSSPYSLHTSIAPSNLLALHSVKDDVVYSCLQRARLSDTIDLRDWQPAPLQWEQLLAIYSLKDCSDAEVNLRLQTVHATSTATALPSDQRRYCCYTCSGPRVYATSGAWRKHEKEHENIYKCKLGGLEQVLAASVDACTRSPPAACPSSCKRRDGMVSHLMKHHGVETKAKSVELADTFRESSSKKFWSCGFCIHLFDSLNERLDHLRGHYESEIAPDPWCLTTEMQGLLCQPMVLEAWSLLMDNHRGQHLLEIFSPRSDAVSQVRERLQMGFYDPQSAEKVAEAAYEASNFSQERAIPELTALSLDDHEELVDRDHILQNPQLIDYQDFSLNATSENSQERNGKCGTVADFCNFNADDTFFIQPPPFSDFEDEPRWPFA